MNKFWEIKNSSKQSADIYLYDEIGKSYWGDSTSAKDFKKELDSIGDVKNLNIYINSPGGSVFDGMAIYNQLIRHKSHKTVYIDGLAASIASVIALAGDKVVMAKNGYFMIHRAWTIAIGNANDFAKAAEDLFKIDEGIIKTYDDRSALLKDEIIQMMDEETWMTGEEALEYGFADELTETEDVAASAVTSEIWAKFRNMPIDVGEKVKQSQENQVPNGRVPVEIINHIYERSIKHA